MTSQGEGSERSDNVLLDWINDVARLDGSLTERINRVAESLVHPYRHGIGKSAHEALQRLLGDVRYVVLNVPAHLTEEHERVFAAVLVPLSDPEEYSLTELTSVAETSLCSVRMFPDSGYAWYARLESEWHRVWGEYATTTRELQDNGIFTWNQYLLHGCGRARPFGLKWGQTERDGVSNYYVQPSREFLAALGLPEFASKSRRDWPRMAGAIPDKTTDWPEVPDLLTEAWQRLEPRPGVNLSQTAAAGIYHLVRSYGRWGGDSFISIPVIAAAGGDRESVVVLSVCSEKALSELQIHTWRTIASSVFTPILASQLVTQHELHRAEVAMARDQAAAWAHEVKNFTGPIIRFLQRAEREAGAKSGEEQQWALEGVYILNAVSYAIQLGIGFRFDDHKHALSAPLRKLPRETACELVESVLQYLLNFHNASTGTGLDLTWTPMWSPEECFDRLRRILQKGRGARRAGDTRDVLCHSAVVWTIALMREVVQNIRINNPVADDTTVRVDYSIRIDGDEIWLDLRQRHSELVMERSWEDPAGIQRVNDLFGFDRGIGLGEVEVLELKSEPASAGMSEGVRPTGYHRVRCSTRIRMALKPTTRREANDATSVDRTEYQ